MSTFYVTDNTGKPVLMRDGTPFVYTTEHTAQMGAKHLRTRVPKHRRPLRVLNESEMSFPNG